MEQYIIILINHNAAESSYLTSRKSLSLNLII